MARPALPPACRWVHVSADEALMHFNYGSVAHVTPGQVWLCWRGCTIKAPHRGGLRQGMRFAERWIAARTGLPGARKSPRKTGTGECVAWKSVPRTVAATVSLGAVDWGPTEAEMDAMESIGSTTITWG